MSYIPLPGEVQLIEMERVNMGLVESKPSRPPAGGECALFGEGALAAVKALGSPFCTDGLVIENLDGFRVVFVAYSFVKPGAASGEFVYLDDNGKVGSVPFYFDSEAEANFHRKALLKNQRI